MRYEPYYPILERAMKANSERTGYARYPENPKVYGEGKAEQGQKAFEDLCSVPFQGLRQPGPYTWVGEEFSPYTGQALGIQYPRFSPKTLLERARYAATGWQQFSPWERAGLLVACLERMQEFFFTMAYATMHTTGQSFLMGFQASGPHAADRALEAVAMGLAELTRFPRNVLWEKELGKTSLWLEKTFVPVPRGIGLVIGCSTFPVWNSVPGIFASLVTGNPVLIKPHPGSVLPLALLVRILQETLEEGGLDPLLCQLAADTLEEPLALELCRQEEIRLIDYTGGSSFGNFLEGLPGKVVFTEKAGVNCVLLESVHELEGVLQNLAFSLCLYSGQMCTAPQNILIPESGVRSDQGHHSYQDVVEAYRKAIQGLVVHPKMGASTLGAIQNSRTLDRLKQAGQIPGRTLLEPGGVTHPEFPAARCISPLVVEIDPAQTRAYEEEWFGPVALVIRTRDLDTSLDLMQGLARTRGAITCGAYCTGPALQERILRTMNAAFTPVSFNFTGPVWINQHAAFSDFHLTGGNPAGNSGFGTPEFLTRRFVWVGNRWKTD